MHEHLVLNFHRVRGNPDGILNDLDLACREVGLYTHAGGRSLVELTSGGLSPDPAGVRRIAQSAGLQVIMGCGWYREPYYPPDMNRRTTNELADELIRDLQVGIGGGDVRAGVIGEIGCLDHI